MNSENLITSSEISSEEGDEHQKEDTAGTKRSYECIFCKRGFTNAQALGGHMNIHRKDRAKAKQVVNMPDSSLLPNKFTNDESMTFPFDKCFQQPSAPNPIIRNQLPATPPAAHAFPYEFHDSRSWPNLHLNQELRGPNLSLQIGPSDHVDNTHQIRRGTQKENEVDLELRLGHHP